MDTRRRATLSPDEQGRVLDRLAGLEKIVTPELVQQALAETDRVNVRRCGLTHEVMLWVVLAMGLFTHLPVRQVFGHSRRLRSEKIPGRSSLCQARQRLGAEPVLWLHEHVVRPLATPETPGAFYKGMRWMGIDGTVKDVWDSPENEAAFHRPSSGRGKGAFPQVRIVKLVELGTHVEVALEMGGLQDAERPLARKLFDRIPPDALLTEDRGFFSYEDWKTLENQGRNLLVRVGSQLILESIERLSDDSFLAKIYPSPYHRDKDRDGIVVRIIEYTHTDPGRTGCGEKHRLMTNLLDERTHPALELIEGYHERWEEELVIDEQTTHQDPRRAEKPAQFRSQTPEGVRQEVYALSLAHFVIRALMFEAARAENLDTDRLSFKGCFHVLQGALQDCDPRTPESFETWYQNLLARMREEKLPPRQNRVNPRVIKRKMSKWKKKRPEHRGIPPSTKPFIQTVVMAN
jgi:hypothetical protein